MYPPLTDWLLPGSKGSPTHFRFNMAKVHLTNEGTVVNREYLHVTLQRYIQRLDSRADSVQGGQML
jgi:hypothetical protein